jgi:tetratricopeptide (TPR) repeat protein
VSRFQHIRPEGEAAPDAGGGPRREVAPGDAGGGEVDVHSLLHEAQVAHERGDFEKALRVYGRCLQRDRVLPAAWLGQVRVLLDMGQFEEAETWVEQAGKVTGEVPAILALRSVVMSRRGKLDEARAWSDRAMKDGSDAPETWLARAEVIYASRNERVARTTLAKAHERDPGGSSALRCGEVALEAGDLVAARQWLERAARALPDSPLVALRRGVLEDREGRPISARQQFERALVLNPSLSAAKLALEHLDRGNPAHALWARAKRWLSPNR